MVRDARERRDATIAWIAVGAMQAAIGIGIAQLRPPVAPGAHDDALVVEVIPAPRVAGRVTRPRS
ncbi:hypothetical protein [Cognatilysobacter segetis]|uniref:hypothetical protein n=1 Tax=Cognatilysobacter segetis TaxID=2492394 RepID=UPI00105D2375|nr:hypothetical protein [Lysobacter segetis]